MTLAIGMQRQHDPNGRLCFVGGRGAFLYDATGRDYVDFLCGYSANNFGHGDPQIVATLATASAQMGHVTGLDHRPRRLLAEDLTSLTARESGRTTGDQAVWLAVTGSRIVEVAWKILSSQRPGPLLVWKNAYHGRSIATAFLSDTARSDAFHAPAAYEAIDFPASGQPDMPESWYTDDELQRLVANCCGLLLEPILAARGYLQPDGASLKRLVTAARTAGVPIVWDEIQTGLGRTGRLFAHRHFVDSGDAVLLGKSLGGGVCPVAAMVGPASLMNSLPPGVESETFAAGPIACSIALHVLQRVQAAGFLSRCEEIGRRVADRLRPSLSGSLPQIRCEQLGAAVTIDFSPNKSVDMSTRFATAARDAGVLVHDAAKTERVCLAPPLTIDDVTLDIACERLRIAIASFI